MGRRRPSSQGLIQGLGAELAFAAFRYRSFRLPTALLAGALTGLSAALFDFFVWNAEYAPGQLPHPVRACSPSSAPRSSPALGGWALTRALANTGVLDRFPAGRDRTLV